MFGVDFERKYWLLNVSFKKNGNICIVIVIY